MAELVAGFGSSHGPLLLLRPEEWGLRADFDRAKLDHSYRDGTYTFEELLHVRDTSQFVKLSTLEYRRAHFQRCQLQLDALGDMIHELNLDALVIIGDDQHEWFFSDIQPPFTVFCGDRVLNSAFDPDKLADRQAGVLAIESERHTPVDTYYDCVPELAAAIIEQAMSEEFDVTSSAAIPQGPDGPRSLGHAFTFIYRRVLRDKPIPLVPILTNTFFPPNQATPKRFYQFGQVVGRAIRSWNSKQRVAVMASGGLSHFVIDEEWDKKMLKAFQERDEAAMVGEPNIQFRDGTSETKNWIMAVGALSDSGLDMKLMDYVPCYRSEAGTGNAMAFAHWTHSIVSESNVG